MSAGQALDWWSKGFTNFELLKKGKQFKKAYKSNWEKCSKTLIRTLLPDWDSLSKDLKERWGITLNKSIIKDLQDSKKACNLDCKLESIDDNMVKEILDNYKEAYKKYLKGKKIPNTTLDFKNPEKSPRKDGKLNKSKTQEDLERSAASMAHFLNHVDMDWNYMPD